MRQTDAASGVYRADALLALTDDTGLIQHSKYSLPDPQHGYSADDNARALLLAAELYARRKERRYLDAAARYARFLRYAQLPDGRFHNFLGYDRRWRDAVGSEDTLGRCVWGLGAASAVPALPAGLRAALLAMLRTALPQAGRLHFVKAQAYALLGAATLALVRPGRGQATRAAERRLAAGDAVREEALASLVRQLTEQLLAAWEAERDGDWQWFEPQLTYSNALVPWALLLASRLPEEVRRMRKEGGGVQATAWADLADDAACTLAAKARRAAVRALDFLAAHTMRDGIFVPVGCQGWWPKGAAEGALYDQQPLEAYEMVAACRTAENLLHEDKYRRFEDAAFSWYTGRNLAGVPLIDEETGGCFDGLTPDGPNANLGAESQIAWGLSCMLP